MTQYSGVYTLQQQGQALTSGQWATDPYYRNTTLLLHADNVSGGAQNNTFVDSSSQALTIARSGNTTQGSFTPYGPTWSTYYTGVADTNGTYVAANSAFSFGTGDFTVEAWVNIPTISNTNGKAIFDSRPNATNGPYWLLGFTNTGQLSGVTMTTGGTTITSTNPIPTNQWVHVAFTRASGNLNLWVNGVSVASASGNTNSISSDTLWIGRNAFSSVASDTWFSGYMSNARIVKGVAVYTGTFTPSTVPLQNTQPAGINIAAVTGTQTSLLIQQSNRFIDNSTYGFTITTLNTWPQIQRFSPFAPQYQYTPAVIGGSGYFDGSDYLRLSNVASQTYLGSGDWTLECWVYYAVSQNSIFVSSGQGSQGYNHQFTLSADSSTGTVSFGFNQGNGGPTATATGFKPKCWNHVAIVRNYSSNNIVVYVNGVGTTTTGVSGAGNSGVGYYYDIGQYFMGTYLLTGYISNLRQVTGVAVYSGNFTPPTAPLATSGSASAASYPSTTNVNTTFAASATQLLVNCDNGGIYDNAMMNDLETVGNAQVSTSVVKYGSGSIAFDGSGDGLYIPATQSIVLGANVTMECFVYFNSVNAGTGGAIFSTYDYFNGTEFGWFLILNSSAKLQFAAFGNGGSYGGNNNAINITGATAITTGKWYHIAFVKNGSSGVIYLNGVSDAAGSFTTTNTEAAHFGIGMSFTGNGSQTYFIPSSYMDEVRFTKDVARYTGNFIPPKVAFANQ